MTPRRELVEPNAPLSMRWQCELLGVNRSSLYYEPVEPDGEQLALMRRMDELHLKHPFFGSRMMTQILKAEGSAVNRKRVQRLMRLMGLESTAPKPNTSKPAPEHTVYPYLLRNLTVSRINQVWARRHQCAAASGARDGGRSPGIALQEEIPNHRKRLWSKAMVVSVTEKVQ